VWQQPQRQPSLDVVARFASHNLCGISATNPADLNLAAEGRKGSAATPWKHKEPKLPKDKRQNEWA